jgi:hypothetical protein
MTSLARMLLDAVRSDPDEKVQQAQKMLARCISEEQYNLEMRAFFGNRCDMLESHIRTSARTAFRFAESLQSFEEHHAEVVRWRDRADEARAKLNALMGMQ